MGSVDENEEGESIGNSRAGAGRCDRGALVLDGSRGAVSCKPRTRAGFHGHGGVIGVPGEAISPGMDPEHGHTTQVA